MARNDSKERAETGFLSRWSERKRGGGEEEAETTAATAESEQTAEPKAWSEEEVQQKLAEIDGMQQGDDFKPLLAVGIPEVVKRAALRKLWRSNPVFGILDGLNDYDLDYTLKPGLVEQVRSAYQAGKGYIYDEEAEAERQAEIAERQRRDKEKARLRAEEAARQSSESPASSAADAKDTSEADNGEATENSVPDTAPGNAPAQEGNAKPRGGAAARRWGGSLG